MTEPVVIVGASLAGAHTALALRRLGYEGPVTLVGSEAHLPYERPELSKGYLAGKVERDQLRVAPHEEYDALGIELLLGQPASAIDPDRGCVTVGGDEVAYGTLVIATGSRNVRPPLPGIDLPGVLQLRTVDDANQLADRARTADRAVVVGMGLVGSEIAATLAMLGLQVTGVDGLPGPLWPLGPEVSAMVRGWHHDHGVQVVDTAPVQAIEGSGRVESVLLADGRRFEADVVVVGVGARPAIEWLLDVPVHLASGGVGVDERLRTNLENVYAAGDVAAVWNGTEHHRVEHYMSAIDQAQRLAHEIVGDEPPQPQPSWFWSMQYEHHLQFGGERRQDDVVEQVEQGLRFLCDGRLTGVAAVDNARWFRKALKELRPYEPPA